MTTQRCDLPDEELITYASGEMRGARAEYVELHLSSCPDCKRRLAEFDAIDRLIARSAPHGDDPVQRAQIKTRIAEMSARPDQRAAFDTWWKPALIVLAVALIGYAFLPINTSLADFRLGRVFQFFEAPSSVPADSKSDLSGTRTPGSSAMVPLTFDIVAPEHLPPDFERVKQSRPSPDRIETRYRNADGVNLRLTQMPIAAADYGVSKTGSEVIPMAGIDVIVQTSPMAGAFYAAHWAYGDYVFSTEIGGDGLTQRELQHVVAALIEAAG